MNEVDDDFYNRADEHIHLSNRQMAKVSRGKVSASMMYSVTRFNAFITSCGSDTKEEMKNERQETIDYFVAQYEKMLKENLDDYIENFDEYKRTKQNRNETL